MDIALTDDQAAVYDRQLRVWGVEVQRKLTAARVLLIGFGQLASEVSKNITLAGVGHVTLLDDSPAKQFAGRNFLITTADAASEQTAAQAAARNLQAMNPLVKVSSAAGSPADSSTWSPLLLQQQDLVIAAAPGLPLLQLVELDASCRAAGVGFMAAAASGPGGWFFVDMSEHKYQPKGSSGSAAEVQVLQYSSFADALSAAAEQPGMMPHPLFLVLHACLATEQQLRRQLTADDLAAVQQHLNSSASAEGPYQEAAQQLAAAAVSGADEYAPVCAVLGGEIANNIVTAVSGSAAPLNNLLYFTLFDGRAIVETRPPAVTAGMMGNKVAAATAQQKQQTVDEVLID